MPRNKRKARRRQHGQAPKEQKTFNAAFKDLKTLKMKAEEADETGRRKTTAPGEHEANTDTAHFLKAMSDVTPLKGPKKTISKTLNSDMRPLHPPPDDEIEGLAHLSDLVTGSADLDMTFSDEYIEGCVSGFDRKLMRKLRKGIFPIQDHIDLHGLTKKEARITIWEFLQKSYKRGLRCVLIVHGRGLNSENHIPVLKERLPVWLSRGPVKKMVLAFSTAMPYDGGTGAIYILLRKPRAQ